MWPQEARTCIAYNDDNSSKQWVAKLKDTKNGREGTNATHCLQDLQDYTHCHTA